MAEHLNLKKFISNLSVGTETDAEKVEKKSPFSFLIPDFGIPELLRAVRRKSIFPQKKLARKITGSDGTVYEIFREKDTFAYHEKESEHAIHPKPGDEDGLLYLPHDPLQNRVICRLNDSIQITHPDGSVTRERAIDYFHAKAKKEEGQVQEGEVFEDQYHILCENFFSYKRIKGVAVIGDMIVKDGEVLEPILNEHLSKDSK